MGQCLYFESIFDALQALTDPRLLAHRAALCADTDLLSCMARRTHAVLTTLPRWIRRETDGQLASTKLINFVSRWAGLPWPPEEPEQAALRRGEVVKLALNMLFHNAKQLERMALPTAATPAKAAKALVHDWRLAIIGTCQFAGFLASEPAQACLLPIAGGADAYCVVVEVLAGAASAVARFFAAVAAGQLPAEVLARGRLGAQLASAFKGWVTTWQRVGALFGRVRGVQKIAHQNIFEAMAREQEDVAVMRRRMEEAANTVRQELEPKLAASVRAAHTLVWMLPQLPQLPHALSGGSGPACPADGCGCAACRGGEASVQLDAAAVAVAIAALLNGAFPWSVNK